MVKEAILRFGMTPKEASNLSKLEIDSLRMPALVIGVLMYFVRVIRRCARAFSICFDASLDYYVTR